MNALDLVKFPVGFLAEVESSRNGLRNKGGIINGGEFHEPRAIMITVEHLGGCLQ